MKKKILAVTLCALIAAASFAGTAQLADTTPYEVAFAFGSISGGY